MSAIKLSKIIWITALVSGAIGILGYFELVVIKGVSQYSFELLLFGYALLVVTRFLKR